MKKMFYLVLPAFLCASCDTDKEEEPLRVVHEEIDLSFQYTSSVSIDLNKDGDNDFLFSNTLVAGDRGTHNLFYVRSLEQNQVLLNLEEEVTTGNWASSLQLNDLVQENQDKNIQWARGTGFLLDIRQSDNTTKFYGS